MSLLFETETGSDVGGQAVVGGMMVVNGGEMTVCVSHEYKYTSTEMCADYLKVATRMGSVRMVKNTQLS